MLISLITVCYNSAQTLERTIQSVASQTCANFEYIIIDGASTDGTIEIIKAHSDFVSKWISEPDKGIYDAMNKGIDMATGEVIGFLNADDVFANDSILAQVAQSFDDAQLEAVFGDIEFVKDGRVVRKYSSRHFQPHNFADGLMPAHPSFYARKSLYDRSGNFRTDFKIAADFDLLLRMLKVHQANFKYLPITFVKMAPGGVSNQSFKSRILLNKEIMQSCKEHGVKTNTIRIYSKYLKKIFEYI
ncbi:glycosyltransferase family 2 protein [Peijinzhouia sedimentorum]